MRNDTGIMQKGNIAEVRAVDPDPLSFSLLDPDPDSGGKKLRKKQKKQEN